MYLNHSYGWFVELKGQLLLGSKCLVSRGIVVQEQDPLDDLPAAFFLQNVTRKNLQFGI